MYYQIQIRRGTAAEWTAANSILAAGELAVETDTNKMKVGNGSTAWASLAYSTVTPTQLNLKADLASPTFTGNVVLPSTTSIGTVSATEIGYVDGVTSAIQTQLDSKLTTSTAVTSGRNAVINGAMKVWQRGTSFTSFNAYAADRWYITGSSNFTFSRQVPGSTLPQFAYCSRMQRNSGSTDVTSTQLGYTLETADSLRFAGKTITVSFWARAGANYSGTSNALYYVLATGTGTDQRLLGSGFTGTAYSVISLVTLTTSWQRFSYTTTVPSTATEICHYFQANLNAGTAGANDFWEVTGVQLEEGAVATPFEFEDYGTTLAKCQRYYQRRSGEKNYGLLTAQTGSNLYGVIPLPVSMRVAPTSIDAGSLRAFDLFNAAQVFYTFGLDGTVSTENMVGIAATATGFTAFRTYYIIHNGASSYLGFSAEL